MMLKMILKEIILSLFTRIIDCGYYLLLHDKINLEEFKTMILLIVPTKEG